MRVALVIIVMLAACGRDTKAILEAPPKGKMGSATKPVVVGKPSSALEKLTVALPDGWTQTYSDGSWKLASPGTTVRISRMTAAVAPSPEDYLAVRQQLWEKGTTAAILEQHKLADGFAMTVTVKPSFDPDHPKRETYVLRHLGGTWIECTSDGVPDDAARDRVIAVCSSAKL